MFETLLWLLSMDENYFFFFKFFKNFNLKGFPVDEDENKNFKKSSLKLRNKKPKPENNSNMEVDGN